MGTLGRRYNTPSSSVSLPVHIHKPDYHGRLLDQMTVMLNIVRTLNRSKTFLRSVSVTGATDSLDLSFGSTRFSPGPLHSLLLFSNSRPTNNVSLSVDLVTVSTLNLGLSD